MTLSELFQTLKTLSKSDLNSIKQILESLDYNYNGFEDKRGNQTHVRGLSHEKVCVPCAVNRNGLSIAKSQTWEKLEARTSITHLITVFLQILFYAPTIQGHTTTLQIQTAWNL